MNKNLLALAAAASILVFSSTVMAGGAACKSKKGHEGLSAESMQQLKEHHDWLTSEGVSQKSEAVPEGHKVKQETSKPVLISI